MPNVRAHFQADMIAVEIYPWTQGRGMVVAHKELEADADEQPAARISVTCGMAVNLDTDLKAQDAKTLQKCLDAATAICVTLDAFLTDAEAFNTVVNSATGEWFAEAWENMAWRLSGLARPEPGSKEWFANLAQDLAQLGM